MKWRQPSSFHISWPNLPYFHCSKLGLVSWTIHAVPVCSVWMFYTKVQRPKMLLNKPICELMNHISTLFLMMQAMWPRWIFVSAWWERWYSSTKPQAGHKGGMALYFSSAGTFRRRWICSHRAFEYLLGASLVSGKASWSVWRRRHSPSSASCATPSYLNLTLVAWNFFLF